MDSQKVTPVAGAGSDPAYVPGLTSPAKETVVEDAQATEAEADEPAGEVSARDEPGRPSLEKTAPEPEDAVPGTAGDTAGADGAESGAREGSGAEPEAGPQADGARDGGVTLEAKDRRGSISVDATGVRYTLDDQAADFTWDEISAVEYGTSRKRLTVTVHTPNSRWYPNDVEAPDKSRLKEWTDSLDKALDLYFED
ncbi:hypothetical protein [Streptomyces sp. NPDC088785]|uniref:hypothetical protein n=1 Tax=Streptomyces sp. NPDC088785 TaxID=3365897 RepID=UPI003819A537